MGTERLEASGRMVDISTTTIQVTKQATRVAIYELLALMNELKRPKTTLTRCAYLSLVTASLNAITRTREQLEELEKMLQIEKLQYNTQSNPQPRVDDFSEKFRQRVESTLR